MATSFCGVLRSNASYCGLDFLGRVRYAWAGRRQAGVTLGNAIASRWPIVQHEV